MMTHMFCVHWQRSYVVMQLWLQLVVEQNFWHMPLVRKLLLQLLLAQAFSHKLHVMQPF